MRRSRWRRRKSPPRRAVIGKEKRNLKGGGGAPQLEPEIAENLASIIAEVKTDIANRAEELRLERKCLDADGKLAALLGDTWITLHVSLLLGDTTERWAVIIGGDSNMHSWQDNPGLYGKIQASFLKAHNTIEDATGDSKFLAASANQTLPQTRVIWGAPFLIHSGEPAGLFGIYNLALGTVQEATMREGTPDDDLEHLKLDVIYRQAADIARFIVPDGKASGDFADNMLGNQIGLSLRRGIVASKEYVIPSFTEDNTVKGPMVMGTLQGTSIPNTPRLGATVQFCLGRNYSLAYNENKFPVVFLLTNRFGCVMIKM